MSAEYYALIVSNDIEIEGLKKTTLVDCVVDCVVDSQFAYTCYQLEDFKKSMSSIRVNIKRYCMLYYNEEKKLRQGTVKGTTGKCEYGKKDEVFVPLGSDGLPMSNATMVTRADVDESGAFEIVQDAIDLALRRYGLPMSSPELLNALT